MRAEAAMSVVEKGDDGPITIHEYERMPEEDAYRVDLVRGRLVRSPLPAPLHGVLQVRLGRRLSQFVEETHTGVVTGEVGVILSRDPDTVRGPDVAYYSTERIPESGYGTGFWGPPDLAVEIASPSGRDALFREKVADYLGAGVRLVWVIDAQAHTITVHRSDGTSTRLEAGAVLDGGDVLPGFRLPLAGLFAL